MRWTLALCTAFALVVAATGVSVATSSSGGGDHPRGGSGDHGRFHVLHVERTPGTQAVLDLDHSGGDATTVGDQLVLNAEFFVGNREIGSDGVVCTKVRSPEWYQCLATNTLPRGDLTVQFLADFTSPEPGRFAITGGTRAYFGATGEVTFVDNPDPARDDVTFRFVTPR